MLPLIKIVSHSDQESVVYSMRPLTIYVAAHAPDIISVTADVTFNGTSILTLKPLFLSQDFLGRMPLEVYALTVAPGLFTAGGTMVITATVISSGGTATDAVTLVTFPDVQSTLVVTDSSSLSTHLSTIAAGSDTHVKITLGAAAYQFPVATSLDTDNTKLVTFEGLAPGVAVEDQDTFVRRARWKSVTFQSMSLGNPCLLLGTNHSHLFEDCEFSNAAGGSKATTFGLLVPSNAYARAEVCYFHDLGTAVVGAEVVRSCFWKDIDTIVFQGIRRALEGTVGEGDPSQAWAYYSSSHSPSIRYNHGALTATPSVLLTDAAASFSNAMLVGNSFQTTGADGFRLLAKLANNNYIVHNTLRTSTSSGSSISLGSSRPVKANFAANNFLANGIDLDSAWSGDNVFDYNASESADLLGENSLSSVVPLFANSLGVLQQSSPLVAGALVQPGVTRAFGTLAHTGQIGAVPFHTDTGNTSVLSHVTNWPEFAVSLT